jgi:putative membrane protein
VQAVADKQAFTSKVPLALLVAFAVVMVVSGVGASYPQDWLLENALVFLTVPVLIWAYTRRPLSNAAYVQIFVFLVLHEIGAHYTYSEVPYDRWAEALTGASVSATFGLARNHFDRLVHFSYGLLFLRAIYELQAHAVAPRVARGWVYLTTFCVMLGLSASYELIEAGAAFVFGRDLGIAYLGTQGDVWDAQKDMGCAAAGALLGVLWLLAAARRRMS